ncbi:MAG TPA: TolC family protein, partial [Phycisphaerae bacterium]|nr:TolC family protein [Phycisphaerae bacterium]
DQPIQEPFTYDVAECVRTALMQRPEMQQQRLQIERADIVLRVAKNDLLPKLDLSLSAQSTGLDNTLDSAFGATINPANSIDFAAGIKFEIPIGNRGPKGEVRQRQLERTQAIEQLASISQQVILDVRTQLREVLSSYAEIAIRERVRQAAAAYFEGIIQVEDVRSRTPEFLNLKLDSQAQLANAEQALIQAIVNYNLAIMHLEQAKGTLLEFDQISLNRAPHTGPNEGINYLRVSGPTDLSKPPATRP